MKMSVLHMQIPSRDRLRPQPIEKRHFGTARDAQIRVLQRLLLLGRLRYHLDSLAVEHADVVPGPVKHLHRQHKVFPLVRVGYEQRLGRTVLLPVVQVQLLHVLVRVADADERAQLRRLLRLALAQHLLLAQPPAVAEQVDAGRRAEEALLVAVGLLGDLGVEDDDHHVGALTQVALHGVAGQLAALAAVAAGHDGAGEARVHGPVLGRRRRRALGVGYTRQAVLVRHRSTHFRDGRLLLLMTFLEITRHFAL